MRDSDRLIIGNFFAIIINPKSIMNGANHKLDGISTYPFSTFEHTWHFAKLSNYADDVQVAECERTMEVECERINEILN